VDRTSRYLVESFGIAEPEARGRARELLSRLGMTDPRAPYKSHRWWSFMMRGLLAIAIGFLFLFRPGTAFAMVALTFSIWIFIDGTLAIGAAIEGKGPAWRLWLGGIAGVAIGIFTLANPAMTAKFLYLAVGLWSIARGISELSAGAGPDRVAGSGSGWLVASGLLSIAFGVVIVLVPRAGAPMLAWFVGCYAIVDGILMIGLSTRIRRLGDVVQDMRAGLRPPVPQPS
jgi:uncharacterized membrane protein HdeD (DUF308 family)